MLRWMLSFLVFLSMSAFAQQKSDKIRILKLLPYVVQPPLVNPHLPQDFILGEREEDPYFSEGYYWGSQGSLTDYFEDPTTLKGCLIRSQLATTVTQEGFDRFSNDGQVNDLTAAGFTEIKVRRGKWGIFPYRELVAKGPRGRKYYQMWVGLNTNEGAALCFQFLYPEYLNEPTQHQKQIWENFVNRTALLNMNDLLVAREVQVDPELCLGNQLDEKVQLIAEKRRFDQKIFIYIEPRLPLDSEIEILDVKEISIFNGTILSKPYLEIHVLVEEDEVISRTSYEIVDQFSFVPKMLSLSRFVENENYLLFQ